MIWVTSFHSLFIVVIVGVVFKFKKVFNYNERLDQLPGYRAFEVVLEVNWRFACIRVPMFDQRE